MSKQGIQPHSSIAAFAKAVNPINRNRQSRARGTGRFRRSIAAALALALFLLCGVCAIAEAFEPIHATVTEVDQFGDIAFDKGQGDLDRIGLEYGDSVDLRFSGGQELKGVPYYSDFFGKMGDPSLVVYFGTVKVGGLDCNLNEAVGVEPGETVTITLDQKGRYKAEYEAYNINNAAHRMEGQTDEAFLNAREVTAGNIRPGRLYRGASPFDPESAGTVLLDSFRLHYGVRQNRFRRLSIIRESMRAVPRQLHTPFHWWRGVFALYSTIKVWYTEAGKKGAFTMPTISLFYGILISMYFEKDGQHHTPHFHARYGEFKAEFDFNGDILAGKMPLKQAAYIKAWAFIHQEELLLNWELAMNDEMPFRIDPLK